MHGWLLVGFIKMSNIHCYTHNVKTLGLVVPEKKFVLCFPIVNLGELYAVMETRVLAQTLMRQFLHHFT